MSTMMFGAHNGQTTALMFGGDVEFDTAVVRNTYTDRAPSAETLEFPTTLEGTVYPDAEALASYLETTRGYVRLSL